MIGKKPINIRNRWVLITGASSGLGLEMARVAARDYGANLLIVARRADRLEALKNELENHHNVQVVPLTADLSQTAEVDRLFETATQDRDIHGVILNAGVTFYGHVLDQDHETFSNMLATNVTSLVQLSQMFSRYLVKKGDNGGIMLVSSVAGFAPMPYQTTYAATKSFVTSFGRGLGHELRGKNVSVTVFAPGGIATEMLENSGLSRKFKSGDFGIMDAPTCAQIALKAFLQRRALVIPGAVNKALALAMKLLPQALLLPQIRKTYEDDQLRGR